MLSCLSVAQEDAGKLLQKIVLPNFAGVVDHAFCDAANLRFWLSA